MSDSRRVAHARIDAILAFDRARTAVRRYIAMHDDPSRLVGVLPSLEAAALVFERASAPDEDDDR